MALTKAQRAEREELAAQGLKRCGKCEDVKQLGEFHKDKTKLDGLQSCCRICASDKNAAYREANLDKERERHLGYREANREQINERQREYQEANREQVRERARTYAHTRRAADPLWGRIQVGATRARKLGCEVITFNSEQLLAYWESTGIAIDQCIYCGGEFEHLDHKIPLGKGGPHSVDNLVPACAFCNISKHNKDHSEFATTI